MVIREYIKDIVITSFLFLTLLSLSGCATTKQKMLDEGMKPVTTNELQSLLSEKRVAKWHDTQKQRWSTVTYLPDGSLAAVSQGNGKTYPGTYTIENDQYCSKMDFRNGEVKCSTWFKMNDKTYHLFQAENGSFAGELTFQ